MQLSQSISVLRMSNELLKHKPRNNWETSNHTDIPIIFFHSTSILNAPLKFNTLIISHPVYFRRPSVKYVSR